VVVGLESTRPSLLQASHLLIALVKDGQAYQKIEPTHSSCRYRGQVLLGFLLKIFLYILKIGFLRPKKANQVKNL
jgi:hypothetical protein